MTPTEPIHIKRVRIETPTEACDSLVAALRAMFVAYGRQISHEQIAAATGCGFMLSFAPCAPDRHRWNVYGRHAFVENAARLFGMSLRPLHPPAAAPLPERPAEFDRHFIDSYLPFIADALEYDLPVLAWMGWPEPCGHLWGVVTAIDPISQRCVGLTSYDPTQAEAMTRSPVQVYTSQDYSGGDPQPAALLDHVLRQAAAILNNRLDAELGVTTGAAAVERWLAENDNGQRDINGDRRILDLLLCDRIFMLRFFDEALAVAPADDAKLIQPAIAITESLVKRLRVCRQTVFEQNAEKNEATERLTETIAQTMELERRLASHMDEAVAQRAKKTPLAPNAAL